MYISNQTLSQYETLTLDVVRFGIHTDKFVVGLGGGGVDDILLFISSNPREMSVG